MRKLVLALCLCLAATPGVAEAAKKKPPKKGPSQKLVRSSIGGGLRATYQESWMTDDQVTITFKKVLIGKARRRKAGSGFYDPYIWAWPVKADINVRVCRTATECEDTRIGWWSRDTLGGRTLFWFDRNTAAGDWHYAASSVH